MSSELQKKHLLVLARQAIQHRLDTGGTLQLADAEIDINLKEERAVFVTLTLTGNLRGCIGHLTATQPLYLDVVENALGAAFGDPRFLALTVEELNQVKIEISILSPAKKLDYADAEDLLTKLKPKQDGVILGDDFHSATYLPQVWEQISSKEDFLSSLCQKAGLSADTWREGKLEIQTYAVESFEEKT